MFALMPGVAGDAYLAGDRLREVDVASENKHKDDEHKGAIVKTFLCSVSYAQLMTFLPALADSVKGKPTSALTFPHAKSKPVPSSSVSTPPISAAASASSDSSEQKSSAPHTTASLLSSAAAAESKSSSRIGDGNTRAAAVPVTPVVVSARVQMVYDLLERIESLIELAPPLTTPSRFGNAAYRTYMTALTDRVTTFIDELCAPSSGTNITSEQRIALQSYLLASFGDARRLDYGTGHELNFMCFIYGLVQCNVLTPADYDAIVLAVFARYIALVRRLLTTYSLEPAGSRGVWGLDDYHFLLYYLGAAQLIGHKHLKPKSARYAEIYDYFGKDWLYLGAIAFVNQVKVCSFAEHSPLLNDITAVKTWDKVTSGLLKMYRADVLGKFAVIQHFIYTPFFPKDGDAKMTEEYEALAAAKAAQTTPSGHHHPIGVDAPCCSDALRIPSAVASHTATPTA